MKYCWGALRLFLFMTLLTGIAYPLLVTLIAKIAFGNLAEGNVIEAHGKQTGALLIAQDFKSDRYFWPRPSSVKYNPLPSGGSNLSWDSATLQNELKERAKRFNVPMEQIPSDLLYASGSGLDPHISPGAARFQVDRIIKARGVDRTTIEKLIDKNTRSPSLGFLGEPCVNVLMLNLDLDIIKQQESGDGSRR